MDHKGLSEFVRHKGLDHNGGVPAFEEAPPSVGNEAPAGRVSCKVPNISNAVKSMPHWCADVECGKRGSACLFSFADDDGDSLHGHAIFLWYPGSECPFVKG